MKKVFIPILFIFSVLVFPSKAKASATDIVFSEIMYNLAGADTDHEWVEIYNAGADSVTIIDGSSNDASWRFNEGSTNHILTLVQGSLTLPAQGVAVLAGNGAVFLTDHPSFSGTLIDTVMSLGNTSETIKLSADKGATFFGEMTYQNTWGGNGDGKSLEKINLSGANDAANWRASTVDGGTPGLVSASSSANNSSSTSTSTPTSTTSGTSSSSGSSGGGGGSGVSVGTSTPVISLKAVAGADIVAEVNQIIKFDGSKSEGAALYKWYLGDGAIKEGVEVNHIYQFPGTYLVTLEVASGSEIALSQIKANIFGGKAVINEIFASAASGTLSWIEIFNPTKNTLDMGNWIIESGARIFTLPLYTVIPSGGYLVLSQAVSNLDVGLGSVKLKYPSGLTIDEVVLEKVEVGFSASRATNGFFWTKETTPGRVNIVTSEGAALLEQVKVAPQRVVLKPETASARNYIASFYSATAPVPDQESAVLASAPAGFWTKIFDELSFWVALVMALGLFISIFYIRLAKK